MGDRLRPGCKGNSFSGEVDSLSDDIRVDDRGTPISRARQIAGLTLILRTDGHQRRPSASLLADRFRDSLRTSRPG
jgi:hypothetical protein